MKKVLFTLAAVAALAACNKVEVIETAPKTPISFASSFVDNTTKAAIDGSYNNSSNLVSEFKVYGTVQSNTIANAKAVNIFAGDSVTKPENMTSGYTAKFWTCTNVQYWVADCNYEFVAIVDGDNDKNHTVIDDDLGMPISIKYTSDSQNDLLYSKVTTTTDASAVPALSNTDGTNKLVAFTFDHLLSKAKFTVKNTISGTTGKYSYKVTDVKINNAARVAVYTINPEAGKPNWGEPGEYYKDDVLNFGDVTTTSAAGEPASEAIKIAERGSAETNYERFMIPASYTNLSATFTVELSINDVPVNVKTYTKEVAVDLAMGNAYNFVIELGNPGQEIKFSVVAVNAWDTDHNNDDEGPDETPIN